MTAERAVMLAIKSDCWSPPGWDGLQYSVSLLISTNSGKKFLHISCIRKIAVTWFLERVFAYLPSFISQILDFIFWTVLIFILIYFEWRDTENQQYIVYVQIHRSNIRCKERNKHVMYHFSLDISFAHTWAHVDATHMRLCHIHTFPICAPHRHKQAWALM